MFRLLSFVAGLVGTTVAALAVLDADSGIAFTLGGWLALIGAVVATVLIAASLAEWAWRGLLMAMMLVAATLTLIAAYFLMQDILLASMGVMIVAVVADMLFGKRVLA